MTTAATWQPIDTAPRDGTLFDVIRYGIRYTDCAFNADGWLIRKHGYPSSTTVFTAVANCKWMARPDDLIAPYETNEQGEKYVP
jgi:hypothetical protein